ncbi:uncharacterized protein LOC131627167 [Vicia villosa]|uniref:uncharacterized protein LOC131627167 n=1 Tax=Vicia villosa TaxID=3911 RepID=UPI00273CCDCA|nr:uncharacterized protein LOC131627167 [Vicia villosa]
MKITPLPSQRNHPNFSWSNNQGQPKPQANQAPQVPPGFAAPAQGNNQLENILKSFIQETKNRFLAQVVSIKNLENQVGKIATALSSRPLGTLTSSTERPSTSGVKNVETCKVIKLRSGKECETPLLKDTKTSGVQPNNDKTEDKDEFIVESTSVEDNKDRTGASKHGKIPEPGKQPEAMPEPLREKKFFQERLFRVLQRPPPPFPQRIRKAKEEQQFDKFIEILKQPYINIPLIESIEQMKNYSKFMKDVLTKRKRVGEFATFALTQECSQLVQGKLPPKLKDPGSFTIPCNIGESF